MSDLWFDPIRWAWLPGTAFGVACGTWGSLAGSLAPMGKARGLVLGLGAALALAAALFLAAGVAALAAGQPYAVWFFLLLPGLIGTTVVVPLLFVVRHRYREAEGRKMAARDLVA